MFETYTDIFNRRGEAYHLAIREQPEAGSAEFHAAVSVLAPESCHRFFDIPSGGADLRRFLPGDVALVAGETSVVFFEEAGKVPGVEAVSVNSADDTGLPGGTFDRIISLAGSHHMPDRSGFYREAFRLLPSGGRLVVADVAVSSVQDFFLNGFVDANNSGGHVGVFLDDTDCDALDAAGFDPVSAIDENYPWQFPDQTSMVRYFTLLFGLDKAKPTRVSEGLRSHLRVFDHDDGRVGVEWCLRFLKAEKPLR